MASAKQKLFLQNLEKVTYVHVHVFQCSLIGAFLAIMPYTYTHSYNPVGFPFSILYIPFTLLCSHA